MRCVLCGGDLEQKLVEEEVKVGADHILVEVEAEVCRNCHERYFAEGVIDRLIELKQKLKVKKVNFPLVGSVYKAGKL